MKGVRESPAAWWRYFRSGHPRPTPTLDAAEVEATLADVPTRFRAPLDDHLIPRDRHPAYCDCTAWRVEPDFDVPHRARFDDWDRFMALAMDGTSLVYAVSFAGPLDMVALLRSTRPRAPWSRLSHEHDLEWSRLDGRRDGARDVGMDTGLPLTHVVLLAPAQWCPVIARPRPALPLDELRRAFHALQGCRKDALDGFHRIDTWAEFLDRGPELAAWRESVTDPALARLQALARSAWGLRPV